MTSKFIGRLETSLRDLLGKIYFLSFVQETLFQHYFKKNCRKKLSVADKVFEQRQINLYLEFLFIA